MGQQLSFIWPALGQRPSGLARQRRAGRSAADGTCRALASPRASGMAARPYQAGRWPGHVGNARARRPCPGSRCAGGAPRRRWVRGQSVPLSRLAHRHDGPGVGFPPMKDSPPIQLAVGEPKTPPRGQVLPPTRYRHPGDVIRLIAAALVLAVAAVIAALFPALLRPAAAAITAVGPATEAGQVLTGLVQVTIAAA